MSGMELHILTIDDDPALHCLVDRAMVRLGHRVTAVTDGASGVSALAAASYDLVIVDYDMPDISGLEVVRAAREHRTSPPIIMLTGQGNERVAIEAFTLGAADYLVKDVDLAFLDLLPQVIDRVLTRRRLEAERDDLFAEVKLREERYRQLIDLIPEGIAILVGGRIALLNPAGSLILGATAPTELIGADFAHCFRESPAPTIRQFTAQATNPADPARWQEFSCTGRSGNRLVVEMTALRYSHQGADAVQVMFRDVTEKHCYQEQLVRLATFDQLTDLPNRTLFFAKFQQVLSLAVRYQDRGALCFIDLDRFKTVNDTYGHLAGDEVLREMASRLRNTVRQMDIVARLGGDEFVVVLAKLGHSSDARAVATKILEELARPVHLSGGTRVELACSIGISLFPDDGIDSTQILRFADHAMYTAKHRGGHQLCFAGQPANGLLP